MIKKLFNPDDNIPNIQRKDIRDQFRIFLPLSEAFPSIGIEDIEATSTGFYSAEAIFV